MPEPLPAVATRLLVDGYDSPVLRDSAGLDLEPFDPRDAHDVFRAHLEEQGIAVESVAERSGRASLIIATAIAERLIDVEVGLKLFDLLGSRAVYSDDDDWIDGGLLYDEWSYGWGRRKKSIATQVLAEASRIAARRRPDDSVLSYVRTVA